MNQETAVFGLLILAALMLAVYLYRSRHPETPAAPIAPTQAPSNLFLEGFVEGANRATAEARERVAKGFAAQQIGFLAGPPADPPTPPKS